MRDGEAADIEITDGEAGSGLKGLAERRIFAPVDIRLGAMREIDGDAALARARGGAQATGVVGMFVRHQNGVQRGDVLADGSQAFGQFAAAQPGVDQNAGISGGHKGGVAGAAAGQDANFDDGGRAPCRSYRGN